MPNEILNHFRARYEFVRRTLVSEKVDDGLNDLKKQGYSGQGIDDLLVCDNVCVVPRSLNRLNIVTWNIATGDKFDEILRYLRDLDSSIGIDILTLQEVGINCPSKKGKSYRNVFNDLCEGLECSGIYGGAMYFLDEKMNPYLHDGKLQHIGEAVLSKLPIDFGHSKLIRFPALYDWRKHIVPKSKNFINSKRVGGRIAVTAPVNIGKEILVSSVHLEDKAFHWEKANQVKYLMRELRSCMTYNQIAAGDFNTFFGRFGLIDNEFYENGFKRANKSISTSKSLPFRLDNVFYRNSGFDLVRFTVDKSVKYSDHYPLIAEFRKV